jgi:hypothetical protein
MKKQRCMPGKLHAMKIRISSFFVLMLLPAVMMGQVTAVANVSATITSVDRVEAIPDSVNLHFRVRGAWNYLMNLTVMNEYGTSSTDILTSPSTDLFLPGKRTPGLVLIFSYN